MEWVSVQGCIGSVSAAAGAAVVVVVVVVVVVKGFIGASAAGSIQGFRHVQGSDGAFLFYTHAVLCEVYLPAPVEFHTSEPHYD